MTKTGVVQSTTHGKNSVTMNRDKSQKRQYVRRKELTFNKFLNDLPKMMYGFGDVPEPFEQSKELLNHMVEEYIKDFVTEAIKDEMGCSLYISGQPGTGKSATINNIIDQINFKKLKTQKGNF